MPVTPYKERVECALPSRMMFTIAIQNVFCFNDEVEGKKDLESLRSLLKFAALQPLEGLPNRLRLVVAKQIDRVHASVMDEYDQQRADKVATTIYYFLKEITDSGYLELWEGSPIAEAAALYLPMIEHVFEIEALDGSAQKQARRVLSKLQSKGYYV